MSIISFQPHTLFELKQGKGQNQLSDGENNFSHEEDGSNSKADRSMDGPKGMIGSPESEKKFQNYQFKMVNKKPSNYDETAEQEYIMT